MNTLHNNKLRFKFDDDHIVQNALALYLYHLKNYKEIIPQRLFLFPSIRCNDQCVYCDRPKEIKQIDFFSNTNHIDKLVLDIVDLQIKDVHLFGEGEPFYYKENVFYFLEKMKSINTSILAVTNANNLTEADIQYIVNNGLISHLCISFNTDSNEMGKKLYLNSSRHEHTLRILHALNKYRQAAKTIFPKVDIMFVLSSINYDKVINIIASLEGLNIHHFIFQPMRVNNENHKDLVLSSQQKKEFAKSIPLIRKKLDELKIASNILSFSLNEDFIDASANKKSVVPSNFVLRNKHNLLIKCHLALSNLAIASNGSIRKCIYLKDVYSPSYYEVNSLREFIKSKEYLGFAKCFLGHNGVAELLRGWFQKTTQNSCRDCSMCNLWEVDELLKRFKILEQELTNAK